MLITETHKKFEGGFNGRLIIKTDAGVVVDTIFTTVQKARRFCESNQESEAGKRFSAAVTKAQALEHPEAVAAPATPIPFAPILEGRNAANTALLSAQRKLVRLYEAARGMDPVAAVKAIRTSRGNKYLNACDDYRCVLLSHFGYEGGVACVA